MGAPTSDLQDFLELQMQKSNEKIVYSQYLKLWYFVPNVLKKPLNLSSLKPHIFFILDLVWDLKSYVCAN